MSVLYSAMMASALVSQITAQPDGGTLDVHSHPLPVRHTETRGYFVGGVVAPLSTTTPDLDTIAAWVDATADAHPQPFDFLGWWVDSETGITHLDAVSWEADEGEALALAAERGEIAVWDIAGVREIRTSEVA